MAKVSIIVPAYNAEDTIERCLKSILGQTYRDFELILMDDGSTDRTPDIIDEFAAKDSRIVPVHKENSGVSDTRNQALDRATGDYVQFLDADDWIAADATRLFVRAMEDNPGCDMVISDFYRVIGDKMSDKGDIEEEKLITRMEYAQAMMKNPADFYYGVLWNKFFRRSIIEEYHLRMDVRLDWAEDFIFNMEYVLHTDHIYVLKAPIYYYVRTKGSLVAQGGASVAKTVRMKLNVIEYYSNFYKDIYTTGNYYLRSPVIYSFLLNFAKDGGVNPVAPDKKIGQGRMDVSFADEMADNPFATNYYEDRLLDNAIHRIVNGSDLDEKDVEVLLYLKLARGCADVNEIRNFTGLSARAVSGSVQKLIRKDILEKVKPPKVSRSKSGKDSRRAEQVKHEPDSPADMDADGDAKEAIHSGKSRAKSAAAQNARQDKMLREEKQVKIRFGKDSSDVQDLLNRVFRDIDEIQLQGFTEEEKSEFRRLSKKAAQNVRKVLAETEEN